MNFSVSPEFKNRYNAAVWGNPKNDNTYLLMREVEQAAEWGKPDKGNLVLVELSPQGRIEREKVIWSPDDSKFSLEDPRALATPEHVIFGLTGVFEEEGKVTPYPAIAYSTSFSLEDGLPEIEVIKKFGPGKNTTPVDENTFFFRKDGNENNHKLFVFDFKDSEATEKGEIVFPQNLEWASHRIGTTMQPLWLNDQEALMLIHGIRMDEGKYIYSIGRARLLKTESGYEAKVDPQPLIVPDHFVDNLGNPLVEELNPKMRRVVYACGGIVRGDKLSLAVNVGDRHTVLTEFQMAHLVTPW